MNKPLDASNATRLSIVVLGLLASTVAIAQGLTVTLNASNYNGFNVSCFGKKNGSIDATVSGGTPPYTYTWSNGAATEDLSGIASGYYNLRVTDAGAAVVEADKTMVEPEAITLTLDPYKYPSGHHISCNECFNGSIDLSVAGGVGPYTYDWVDGAASQDRSGLGSFTHYVTVTDANGCVTESEKLLLSQPERMDWTMEGNANTVPGTHFFGTTDDKDVVFKSNGTELIRLKGNGDISLLGNFPAEGPLYRMEDGTLKGGEWPTYPELPPGRCRSLPSFPYWETRGNAFPELCDDEHPVLGTLEARPLSVITSSTERIHVSPSGKVGIGTVPPSGAVSLYRLFVADGIATRGVLVKLGDWPDYVFKEGYHLMPLDELKAFLARENHLPGIPSAAEVAEKGGVEIGELQRRMLETIEQQALYILQLEERLTRLETAVGTGRLDQR